MNSSASYRAWIGCNVIGSDQELAHAANMLTRLVTVRLRRYYVRLRLYLLLKIEGREHERLF